MRLWVSYGLGGLVLGFVFFLMWLGGLNGTVVASWLWDWPMYGKMSPISVGLLHTASYGILGMALGLVSTRFRD